MRGSDSTHWQVDVPAVPDDRLGIAVVGIDVELRRQTAATLMQALGPRTRIVEFNGYRQALAALRGQRFDVGLVELRLDGCSGLDLVQALGGREAPTPLILLAGADDDGGGDGDDQRAMQAGAYDFLDRTEVTPRSLARAVRHAAHTHELERKLYGALHEARAATRAKSEFLARMSHDLRTPLNAILGFSEIIKDEMFGKVGVPAYVGYAGDINVSALQLLELINDILDLSRVEARQLNLKPRQLRAADIIDDVVRQVRPTASARDVALTVQCPVSLHVLADERSLRRMLGNLLSNALKFTAAGGLVTVRAGARPDGCEIAVVDTGIGIAPRDLAAVRAPFHQIDSGLMTAQAGSGLGLAIVEALMRAHHGRLELESEVGVGTTARLVFGEPRRTDQPDTAA